MNVINIMKNFVGIVNINLVCFKYGRHIFYFYLKTKHLYAFNIVSKDRRRYLQFYSGASFSNIFKTWSKTQRKYIDNDFYSIIVHNSLGVIEIKATIKENEEIYYTLEKFFYRNRNNQII